MEVPQFLTKNGTTDFLSKQKNLFDTLKSAEKDINVPNTSIAEFMEIDNQKSNKRKRKETKQFRGKESLFKEPVDLPRRFKKSHYVPDFQRNPHKWVKYSLADISQEDMSNESNTAAALAFLKELKVKKKLKAMKLERDVEETKFKPNQSNLHKFNARVKQEIEDSKESPEDVKVDSQKPVFKSTKLIMPEYVVGQVKKESKPMQKKFIGEKGKEVYLNHIHEYDDE